MLKLKDSYSNLGQKLGLSNSKLRHLITLLFFALVSVHWSDVHSQTMVNGAMTVHAGDTQVDFSQNLIFGANAIVNIDGVLQLGSTSIDIDPGAQISGNGTIVFADHSQLKVGSIPLSDQKTQIDANSVSISCKLKIENSKNLELSNSDLKVTKDVELAVNDGHIVLGANDLILASTASISSATENRYVVTNSTGELVREGLSGSFLFPVGNQEGTFSTQDYTPCALNNTGVTDTFRVRVSATVSDGSSTGVDHVGRQWHIEENTAGGSVVDLQLQHNGSSEETEYDNAACFVAQYIGTSPNSNGGNYSTTTWDLSRTDISQGSANGSLTTGAAISGASVQNRSISDFFSNPVFTKLSNLDLCIAAKVFLQAPLMGTGSSIMQDSLRSKSLIPVSEPYTSLSGFTHYGRGGGEQTTSTIINAAGNNAVVDWVIVDLIDKTNNQSIVASQSALLQRDGDIISAGGEVNVCFSGLTTDSFYVGVRHRNHLPIQTAAYYGLDASGKSFDFSSIGVYGSNSLVTINSVKAMWAGDPNSDEEVIFSGAGDDGAVVLNAVLTEPNNVFSLRTYGFDAYQSMDVNMDGRVQFSGLKNDVDLIKNNVLGHPGNVLNAPTYKITGTRP